MIHAPEVQSPIAPIVDKENNGSLNLNSSDVSLNGEAAVSQEYPKTEKQLLESPVPKVQDTGHCVLKIDPEKILSNEQNSVQRVSGISNITVSME